MYTLFQIMTLESWSMGIVRPVMKEYPLAWIFFVPFILVTTFAILNLFIGIIVDAMQQISSYGKDVKKYQVLQNQACDEMARTTKDDGFVVISQTDRKINGEILPNHITYYNAMLRNGYVLKDYKIMVRNYPVDKRDMYYFNYQHCL